MRKLIILLGVIVPVLASAQNFVNSKYDEQGRLTATYSGADRNNYEYTKFYENGVKKEFGLYKNGEKHGIWKTWAEDGRLEARARYKNGMKTGKWTIWDNGEKQVFQINFDENNIKTAYKKDQQGHVIARR